MFNVGGGPANTMSLAELTTICDSYFGRNLPEPDDQPRPFDLPWIVMDSQNARERFQWQVEVPVSAILEEIAAHVRRRPEWLDVAQGKAIGHSAAS